MILLVKLEFLKYDIKLTDIQLVNVKCFWIYHFNIFELYRLTTAQDAKSDRELVIKDGGKLHYNFCSNTIKDCNGKKGSIIGYKNDGDCFILSSDSDIPNKWSLLGQNLTDGISIKMNPGELCRNGNNYTITYEMECSNKEFEVLNSESIDLSNCDNTIKIQSKEACPKLNYYIISSFLDEYKNFLGVLIIVIGLFLVFLSAKFLKITILIISMLSSTTILFILFFLVFHPSSENTVWILLALGLVLGLGLGYLLIKIMKGFIMLLGGYFGYLVSIFIYDLLLKFIHTNPDIVYWVTTIASIFSFSLFSLWVAKITIILGTSIIGSYGVIRGASLYIGYFPSENVVIDLIKHEEIDELNNLLSGYVYIYLIFWVSLAVVGILTQTKLNKETKKDYHEKLKG